MHVIHEVKNDGSGALTINLNSNRCLKFPQNLKSKRPEAVEEKILGFWNRFPNFSLIFPKLFYSQMNPGFPGPKHHSMVKIILEWQTKFYSL